MTTANAPKVILIVDDEELNRDMLSQRLELKGYKVTATEDGRRALALVCYALGLLSKESAVMAPALLGVLWLAGFPGRPAGPRLWSSVRGLVPYGVVTAGYLALRFGLRRSPPYPPRRGACVLRRVLAAERWRIVRHGSLPYGVAIACGGIWAVLTARGG